MESVIHINDNFCTAKKYFGGSIIMEHSKKLTNEVGAPIADNEHAITAGPRGPVVMQDVWLMEKMAHFNREVIPERRMHANNGLIEVTIKP